MAIAGLLSLICLIVVTPFAAIAGSGGWKPSITCRLDFRGELHMGSIPQNKPPYVIVTDTDVAAARLRHGETIEVLFYGDSITNLLQTLEASDG